MEQNKRLITPAVFALASIALLSTGCSENNDGPISVTNIKAGEPVSFSSQAGVSSRSIYSDDDDYQIHWVAGDEISIYSNEAWVGTPGSEGSDPKITEGLKFAHYSVFEAEDKNPHGHITPQKDDETILWSSHDADHTFYAVHPKCRNISIDRSISMKYHTNQECNGLKSDGNGNYTTSPDMRNAYMVAKNTASAATTSHVLLHFDPIMTTLDLTVTAGMYEVGTGIIQPISVTGVSVIMPKYLKNGSFIYDMNANGDTSNGHADGWMLTTVGTGETESVFVGVVDDRSGTEKHYVDLFEGETLRLTAFLPPMDVDYYHIKIHTTSGFDFIKKVNADDLAGAINKRSRINIILPNIYPDGAEYIGADGTQAHSGNSWMSRLPESTPLTKLSIPGYICDKGITAQEVEYLLNHGVRAFDLSAFMKYNAAVRYDLDMAEDLLSVFNDFIKNHSGETIFAWMDTQYGAHWKVLPDGWTAPDGFNNIPLSTVRGNIIALEKHSTSGISAAGKGSTSNFFNYANVYNISLNGNWQCNELKAGNNQDIFNSLFPKDSENELTQTGACGIVMIPNANKPFDNGAYTNSDLLIQGIIDCNYKFNIRK